jgi:hypothetical protein
MSKVIEIIDCSQCPYKWTMGSFCGHPDFAETAAGFMQIPNTAIIPAFCPLQGKDDFCESNFDIDREP